LGELEHLFLSIPSSRKWGTGSNRRASGNEAGRAMLAGSASTISASAGSSLLAQKKKDVIAAGGADRLGYVASLHSFKGLVQFRRKLPVVDQADIAASGSRWTSG